ncbi:MAG: hypothetical protein AB1778_07670 [Candidatus Bipolaricaulota bacterium]
MAWQGAAVRVIPNRFDLAQKEGTEATYTLRLESDRDETEDVRLYVGDWLRTEDGEHDWGVPANGARWTFDRVLAADEVVVLRYRWTAEAGGELEGSFQTGIPQVGGRISGPKNPEDGAVPEEAEPGAVVLISRAFEGRDVTLTVRTLVDVQGLTLYEVASDAALFESLESSGAQFATVARSCTSWIELSQDRATLDPGATREITVSVKTPLAFEGSYWSAVFVESQPEIVEQSGTRVLTIPRAAIKVFVTASGTEAVAGLVTGFDVSATEPLTLAATFQNAGNVEVAVSGVAEVIDRTGTVVRRYPLAEVKVLPGGTRRLVIGDAEGAAGLPSGIYQAVVRLEYGGESPVAGVRAFRVP